MRNRATAQHSEARYRNARAVKQLLTHPKMKVKPMVTSGAPPLMSTCDWGHGETVSVLAPHPQPKINMTTKYGDTALTLAAMKDEAGRPALYYARMSKRSQWEIKEVLVEIYLQARAA